MPWSAWIALFAAFLAAAVVLAVAPVEPLWPLIAALLTIAILVCALIDRITDRRTATSHAKRKAKIARRKLEADLHSVRAEIDKLEYFRMVATEYNDPMRAGDADAELGLLQAEEARLIADLEDMA